MSTSTNRSKIWQPELSGEGLALLAQAAMSLRGTTDTGTACGIAGACAVQSLGASDCVLIRVDRRSGALYRVDDLGVETPHLAEAEGPVEWVLRHERALFDDGAEGPRVRESRLWHREPAAIAAVPLHAGSRVFGLILLSFDAPRTFEPEARMFLQALADVLALTLERTELRRDLDAERHRFAELDGRLNQAEEAATNLMAAVAQEIRSPLSAIKGYTESLLESLHNPHAPREKFLDTINNECDRLARLVTDILDLSRLEAGQCPLHLMEFDVANMLDEVLTSYATPASQRHISLATDVEQGLRVEADPDLVRRLIGNLLSEALRCSPESGTIKLQAHARDEEWTGCVEDQGAAIPRDQLPRVFERFQRVRPAAGPGNGLGLPIARGIVELHGGRVWVESSEGGGARFCFALPRRQVAPARARRLVRVVCSRPEIQELFRQTVEMVGAALDAEIVSLMLVDPDRGDLFVAASRGLEALDLGSRRTPMRAGVAGAVAAWGRPLLVENIETDRRFRRLNHPQYRTKSLMCVPMRISGEVIGVVNVNNKTMGQPFDDSDLALLAALVERVGSAIERASAYPDSGRVVEEAVEAVRSVIHLKRKHALGGPNLVRLARATARELRMTPTDVDVIGYVASVHDLGMTRIQEALGDQPELAPGGREALADHPGASVEMLRPLEYLGAVRELILSHHERWDGSGYPRGLKAEEIPLGGRVLAVVDAYESMTAGRPYRAPRSSEQAIEELRREAGRQFDPEVVEALVRALEREGQSPS